MLKRILIILVLSLVALGSAVFPVSAQGENDEEDHFSYYSDVPWSHWAIGSINSLTYKDIIKGYEDLSFKPDQYVTREQIAVLLFRSLKLSFPLRIKQPSFTDVEEKRWSYAYVETVKPYLNGYMVSGGKQIFKPAVSATRQDVAMAVVKALNYKPSELKNKNILKDKFSDYAKIPADKQVYVALAVENNLINGFPDRTFRGSAPVTRAQAAALLSNVISQGYEQELGPMLDVKMPEKVTNNNVIITGTTEPGATVFINGKTVSLSNGKFTVSYTLDKEGTYEYVITSQVPKRKVITTVKRTVKFEYPIPVLTINTLPKIASTKNITVTGKVIANGSKVNLYLNNNPVFVNQSGTFSTTVTLNGGENILNFVATNNYGKSAKTIKVVYFDDGGPALYVESIPETTSYQEFRITGQITDKNDPYPQLYFNNKLVQQWEDGTFEVVTILKKGENILTFKAIDRHGKTATIIRKTIFNAELPTLVVNEMPAVTSSTKITVTGKISDKNDSNPKLYMNNKAFTVNNDGTFSIAVELNKGINNLNFTVVNKLGDSTSVSKKVTMAYPPVVKLNTKIPEQVTYRTFSVNGTVTDSNGGWFGLNYNGVPVTLGSDGSFYVYVTLNEGENILEFTVVNEYGVSTTLTRKVTYKKTI